MSLHFQIDLSLLSKYRTQLMGIAMLWIIWAHTSGVYTHILLIDIVKNFGYGGVDIFLFLSGIGNFFSLKKDDNVLRFYKRRLIRILPVHIIIALLYGFVRIFINNDPVSIIFNLVTTLFVWQNRGPFIQEAFSWYIAFILVMYLITPLFSRYFKNNPIVATLIAILFSAVLTFILIGTDFNCFLIMTTRIPIYFIGYLFGYFISKKLVLNMKWGLILFFSFLLGLSMEAFFVLKTPKIYMWIYGLFWLPFILITPFLSVFLSFILSLFKKYTFPVLTFFGTYSLSLYLTHDVIFNNLRYAKLNTSPLIYYLLATFISVILSYLIQNFVNKLCEKNKKENM